MNNKKVQANMQINVSFLGDTTKLVKQLESSVKSLNLESSLTKQLSTSLTKGFKDIYGNIDKMAEGLSRKGLSSKQYTMFFNEINTKLINSLGITKDLKKELNTLFNSSENKQGLKVLEEYKKQLTEIKKLASSQKGAKTRQNTSINKLKEETGLDYNLSKRMISGISARKSNNQSLTKNQQDWAAANGLDDAKLKRVLELYKQIVAQARKMDELNKQAKTSTGQNNVDASIEYVEKQIEKLNSMVITPEANKQNMVIATQIEGISKAVEEAAEDNLPKFTNELKRSEEEAQKLAQASSTIKEIFAQFGISFTAATVVRGFQDLARSAFEFYKSLDSALNEIYIVSDLSINQVNKLQTSFINMAKNTGMALDDVTKSAVLFYQQGLNTSEVLEMTRVTSEFAKVAGIDATDAADKLTAAVNGYCLAASDAIDVADKFNQVAAASAADINELSTAFSKAAAQANQAGVSMDNYLAYIATMEEATREAPENIGTSLKTIFSRMQQVKEAGTSEDGETDVNAVETALRSVGIQLRDTEGQLRDLEEIFDELGPKWNQLDRNTQAYLGTIIAGTRQQSRFITLMQNWDRVEQLADESANSAGRQALMHARAMESIESKLQQFQVAWQEFVSNLASSDLFKGIIESLTKLINLINTGNKPMILLSLAIAAVGKKLKDLQLPLLNKIKDFGAMFGKFSSFKTDAEKETALKNNQQAQIENEKTITSLQQEQLYIRSQIDALEQKKLTEGDLDEENQTQLNELKKEELELQKQINTAKKNGTKLTGEEERIKNAEVKTKRQRIGSGLSAAGMAVSSLGLMSGDTNTSGILGGIGSGLSAAGQFATGNWIGGAMSTFTAVYQLTNTLSNWEKNLEKKMTDAVNKVNSNLSNVNNTNTGIKSTEKLIKRYNELNGKVVKTTAEQKEFNSVVQELGDTNDIEVLTDAYGNLSINIGEVNEKLKEQYAARDKAMKELSNQEIESLDNATSGWFGKTNGIGDYTHELFSTNRSEYKNLLSGIEDGLTDETRKVSKNIASSFSSNLKSSMMDEIENNAETYIGDGFGNALVDMEEELNGALNSMDWNDLYGSLDFLQSNIENMSFDEAQEYLQQFYDNWSGKNKLTQDQWDLLVDSINNTVFENSSLIEFYNKVNEMQGKANGTYYENKMDKLNKAIAKQQRKTNIFEENVGGSTAAGGLVAGGTALGTMAALSAANIWNPAGWVMAGITGIAAIGGGIAAHNASNTDDAKKLKAMQKAQKELEKERKEYLKSIAEENYLLADEEDAEKWINAQTKVSEAMQKITAETQEYINNIESLYDFSGLGADEANEYAKTLEDIIPQLEGLDNQGDKYNVLAKYYKAHQSEMSADVKEQWQVILDEAYKDLNITSSISFTQLGNELKDISKDLQTMNSLVKEFKENGAMSIDTFMDLADIIDNINLEDLGSIEGGTQYIDNMINALDNLNLAYDANNGMITMNGESLQSLQAIQEAQTKAKIAGVIADLKASKATTETEIAYIDAQIAGAQAMLTSLETIGDGKIDTTQLFQEADAATEQSLTTSLANITNAYKNDVTNNNTWKTAVIKNLADASSAWNAYYTAVRNGTADTTELYNKAMSQTNMKWEGQETSGINFQKYNGTNNVKGLKDDLNDYISRLENTKTKYSKTLALTNQEINLMTSLYNSDLSNLANDGSGGSENKIEQYIGQLKEVYNILNRIQVLEHRLSTLDTYADISKGEKYGSLLQERLGYNEQLLSQYNFLVSEQKQFTNGYKDFIGSVSGLEGVFDFDKYGQIIINWEKYINLQDQAANGEVTLKQKADDVYETYTSMFKELQDDFDNYIKYLKAVIDLQQEMIDSYVSMEDKAANAVKEIYQKILNTKLEAIDKEKEAIEDLRKAREEARKDQENAKAVSGLQTNIQRAMMDTSGASDSTLIKAQQDLDDKLEEIAEDKYSKMLDDIIDQLEEEQNALQDEFDQLWENMDWLFDWLDTEVMRDEERLNELLQQTEEWNTSSALQREQLMQDWNTEFETYIQGLESGKTILDVWDSMNANRERIGQLDTSLVNEMSKDSKEIVQTIKSWQTDVNNTISSAVSSAAGSGGRGYSTSSPSTSNNTGVDNYSSNTSGSSGGDGFAFPKDAKVRSAVGMLMDGYKYDKNGDLVTPPTQSGWDSNKVWTSGETMYVSRRKSYNGSNYYGLAFSKGGTPVVWANGYQIKYKNGGFADFTGPAWLDGTKEHPEAVLNALQTEHFIKFTDTLDKMYSSNNFNNNASNAINIGNIAFQVDSMSSPEDGEKAFNVFVSKFKEIGNQTGIKIDTFKNTL